MPSITGRRYGGTYGPYLRLDWSEVEQDITGNRTKLRLDLRFISDAPYGIYYTFHSRTVVLQGSSTTYSGSVSGQTNRSVYSRDIWVDHNSDGKKSITLSGEIRNLGLNFSGTNIGTMAVSGAATLTPIPRGSTLSSFSFASSLKPDTKATVNYNVNRHVGTFRHQLQLRSGSVTYAQWDNLNSSGSSSVELSEAQVNSLLNNMSNTTSKSFTLRLATRSGTNGSWVGAVDTRTASASVHGDVVPRIISHSAKVTGNSWAVDQGLYVQGQTGVQADFSSNATGGAGVKSRSIKIGNTSGGGVVGSVFRHSQALLSSSGTVTITYSITDSRDRTTTDTRKIDVLPYSPPKISSFTASRGIGSKEEEEVITISPAITTHTLGGRNRAQLTIVETLGNGTTKTISSEEFSESFSTPQKSTVSSGTSATYLLTVTDTLGVTANSSTSIGTAFMEMTIRRGEGVGIGKVHQKGSLDVDGEAYFSGDLFVNDTNVSSAQSLSSHLFNTGKTAADTIEFWQNLPQGTYYVANHVLPGQPTSFGIMVHSTQMQGSGSDFNTIWYSQSRGPIYRKSGNQNSNHGWRQISNEIIGNKLWSGSIFVHTSHTVTPTKALSQCNNGWILEWSAFSSGVREYDRSYTFIPKMQGSMPGNGGIHQLIGLPNYAMKSKYIYCKDTYITGNDNNSGDGVVLRSVYEW